jgi:hypothetical protein
LLVCIVREFMPPVNVPMVVIDRDLPRRQPPLNVQSLIREHLIEGIHGLDFIRGERADPGNLVAGLYVVPQIYKLALVPALLNDPTNHGCCGIIFSSLVKMEFATEDNRQPRHPPRSYVQRRG